MIASSLCIVHCSYYIMSPIVASLCIAHCNHDIRSPMMPSLYQDLSF